MDLSTSTHSSDRNSRSKLSRSISAKQMRQLWDLEITRAWKEMQRAIARTQSGSSV